MRTLVLLLLAAAAVNPARAQNQDSAWLRAHYTKQEVYIPMRDGVRLFTAIYTPLDTTHPHPILLLRTPYSCAPYGAMQWWTALWLGYFKHHTHKNYCIVLQDVRGAYMSEGDFVNIRPYIADKKTPQDVDEASDTYDTIDWLLKNNRGNNGRVGVQGISYPGFYAAMAALCGHPALKAVSPQAPVTDWFQGDDLHHNGAFFLEDAFSFYVQWGFGDPRPLPTMDPWKGMSQPDADSYRYFLGLGALPNITRLTGDTIPFWNELMNHPDRDAWWEARDDRKYVSHILPTTATLVVGGLFDAEDLYGAWHLYEAIESGAHNENKLVIGPWYHGQWSSLGSSGSQLGDIPFRSATGDWYKEHIEIPFFDAHLLGDDRRGDDANSTAGRGSGGDDLSEATIFFTGENRWRKLAHWPPAGTTTQLYLDRDHQLSSTAPASTAVPASTTTAASTAPAPAATRAADMASLGASGFDRYRSDPANPVPYAHPVPTERNREYMDADQRFAAARKDVLVYETPPLDHARTFAGPLTADLWVSLSTTDADFVVKLIDVFPANTRDTTLHDYQMLVRGDVFRGRYRHSFSHPEPFVPNQPTEVKFDLNDIAHTFEKGHRIMVQIQSSWFPLVDRNPQQFVDIYHARDSDFVPADITVWHDVTHPSHVTLNGVSGGP